MDIKNISAPQDFHLGQKLHWKQFRVKNKKKYIIRFINSNKSKLSTFSINFQSSNILKDCYGKTQSLLPILPSVQSLWVISDHLPKQTSSCQNMGKS